MVDKSINLGTMFTADASRFIKEANKILKKVTQINKKFNSMSGKGFDRATKSINKTTAALNKNTKATKKNAAAAKQMGGAWGRIVAAMKTSAAFGVAGAAIYGVVNALKVGVQEIIAFDQALKNLQAITRATDSEVAGMGDVIRKVAEETKFSTGEVAEGMVLLGQAGFSAAEAMQSMSAVANLATGTLSDMRMTSDLLTSTVRAFGLATSESARVADVMANAINRSKLTIDKLRIAFNFVGAAAAQTGLSLEETAASMMVLANNGIRASTIGTGLRQVLARLLAPNRNLREEFEAQGIELAKVNPKLEGFQGAMKNLIPILVNMETRTVDMTKAYRLFGLRGAQAVAILARAFATKGANSFDDMYNKVLQVGTASEMAAKQMEGLGVKLKNLADRLKLIAVSLGTGGLIDIMKILVDTLRALASTIVDFLESSVGRITVSFVVWTTAIVAVTKALTLMSSLMFAQVIPRLLSMVMLVGRNVAAIFQYVYALVTLNKTLAATSVAAMGAAAPFIILAAVIGGVIARYRYLAGEARRRTEAAVAEKRQTENLVSGLKAYEGALLEVLKKQKQGKDVTKEHTAIIDRMKESYKEATDKIAQGINLVAETEQEWQRLKTIETLDDAVSTSTDNIVSNLAAVRQAHEEMLKQQVVQSAQVIKLYQQQAEAESEWSGRWEALKELFGVLGDVVWDFFSKIGAVIEWFAGQISMAFERLGKLGHILTAIQPGLKAFAEGVEWLSEAVDVFNARSKRFSEEIEKDAEATKEANREIIKLAESLFELTKGKATAEEILRFMRDMQGIELNAEQVQAVMDALNSGEDLKLTEEVKALEDALSKVPNAYKKIYDKLDTIRKASFLKQIKSIEREAAAAKDTAATLLKTEKDRFAEVEYLYAKGLVDFVEKENKKKFTVEERYKMELEQLDVLAKAYEEEAQTKIDLENKIADAQIEGAKTNEEQEVIHKQRLDKISQLEEQLTLRLTGIQAARNYALEGLEQENAEKRAKIYKKTTNEYIKELDKRKKEEEKIYEKVVKDVDDVLQQIKESREKSAEDAKEIRQKDFTDEQRYHEDLRMVNEALAKARLENDAKAYGEAARLAEGLTRVVRDENGKIIHTYNETSYTQQLLIDTIEREVSALKKMAADTRDSTIATFQQTTETMMGLVQKYEDKIDEASQKELALQTEEAIKSIEKTYEWVDKFKELWDSIDSKDLTISVSVEGGASGGSSSSGGESDSGGPASQDSRGSTPRHAEGGLVVGYRQGGLVSPSVLKTPYRQSPKVARIFKKGGIVTPTATKTEIHHFREGGKVEKDAIHLKEGGSTDKSEIVIEKHKEGGRVDSSIISDIFRFKEGGRVEFKDGGSAEVHRSTEKDTTRQSVFKDGGTVISDKDRTTDIIRSKEGGLVQRFKEGGQIYDVRHTSDSVTVRTFNEGGTTERSGGDRVSTTDSKTSTTDSQKTTSTKERVLTYIQKFKEGGSVKSDSASEKISSRIAEKYEGGRVESSNRVVNDIFRFKEGGSTDRVKSTSSSATKETDTRHTSVFKDGGVIEIHKAFNDIMRYQQGGSVFVSDTKVSSAQTSDSQSQTHHAEFKDGGTTEKEKTSLFRFFKVGGNVEKQTSSIIERSKNTANFIKHKLGGLVEVMKYKQGGSVVNNTTSNFTTEKSSSEKSSIMYRRGGGIDRVLRSVWTHAERGLKMPGYGGGDRHPIIVESGEWVIRKEAVKRANQKFGSNFIKSINNMTFDMPSQAAQAQQQAAAPAPAAARHGGQVTKSGIKGYAEGGSVAMPVSAQASGGDTFNITLKPTFMTGDRRSAMKAAQEIEKYLKYNKHRKGGN
jgi:TP901 family phage tail tape measure protein